MPPIAVAGLCTPDAVRAARIDCATAYLVDNKAWLASIANTFATAVARANDQPQSLPGFGPKLGAEFLVGAGANLASFADSGRPAPYAGFVPVPRDSACVTGNLHWLKSYHRWTRRVLGVATLLSIRADGLSRQSYDDKRAQRLIHTQALLALARRCSAPEGFRTSAPHRKGTC